MISVKSIGFFQFWAQSQHWSDSTQFLADSFTYLSRHTAFERCPPQTVIGIDMVVIRAGRTGRWDVGARCEQTRLLRLRLSNIGKMNLIGIYIVDVTVFKIVDSSIESLLHLEESRHIGQHAPHSWGIVRLLTGTRMRKSLLKSLQKIVRLVQFANEFVFDILQIMVPIASFVIFNRLSSWMIQSDSISLGG